MVRIKGFEKKRVEVEVETRDLIDAIASAFKVNKDWWYEDGKVYCETWYGSHSSIEKVNDLSEKQFKVMEAISTLRKCL